jgi:hypothetical protein
LGWVGPWRQGFALEFLLREYQSKRKRLKLFYLISCFVCLIKNFVFFNKVF